MHLRHHGADGSALHGTGFGDVTAFEPGDQCGRFAVQRTKISTVANGYRTGAGFTAAGKVGHQIQVKRQLGRRQLLEQGQHITTAAGGDEIVGVFDTRADALQVAQFADVVILQPVAQFVRGYRGEDGH